MLSITWSKLGLNSSSMMLCVAIASSFSPPLPSILFGQICSSSSFESLIGDPKIILDFFLGGEVTSLRLNMSIGVGGFVHVFSQRDWCVGTCDVVVEHANLFSFKNCSLVTSLGETYCCCVA